MRQSWVSGPAEGNTGSACCFCPTSGTGGKSARITRKIIQEEGQTLLGWRTVPVNDASLGETAKLTQPYIRQVFVAGSPGFDHQLDFERKLYVIRKRAEKEMGVKCLQEGGRFYFPSFSCRTIVYKGMLVPEQLAEYYPDLNDPDMEVALALVHSRFSTNTFPSWERAHPYRYLIHDGEINTLRGNINWMYTCQSSCETELFGEDLKRVFPVIDQNGQRLGHA